MWKSLRKICCFPVLWPLYFIASFFKNYNLRIVNYIIDLYYNIMGIEIDFYEGTWPFEEDVIEEDGQEKIIYYREKCLESMLSRKFRRSKNND